MSTVVTESTELGVEQARAGDWGGARGEGVGLTQHRKHGAAAGKSTQQQGRAVTGIP
jgi:hypothetical protein